jgi:hypothetical protein
MTYRSITTLGQNAMAGSGSQRLSARDDAIGTVDSTPATGERHKIGVRLGVDGFGVERHDERKWIGGVQGRMGWGQGFYKGNSE